MRNGPPASADNDEFPLLASVGLYAAPITGDGNCLFHALSDQLYGHENAHAAIRAAVITHMREHADFFKLFLEVPAGGGGGGGKKGTKKSTAPATEAALDAAFEQHLTRMSRSGVYGDNLELTAFARAYACDVKIYQREFAYVISCGDFQSQGGETHESRENFLASAPEGVGLRDKPDVCHIAYHTWEHYSSVRNLVGPWTGLPLVAPRQTDVEKLEAGKRRIREQGVVMPWMLKAVRESLPWGEWGDAEIGEMLEKCKGDVGEAVGRFLEKEEGLGEDGGVDADAAGDERVHLKKEDETPRPESPPKLTKAAAKKQARQALLAGGAKHKAVAESVSSSTITKAVASKKEDVATKNIPKKGKASHPKKETPRERKERQKAEAQSRKKGGGVKEADKKSETNGIDDATAGGIRELYI